MLSFTVTPSPVGALHLVANTQALVGVYLPAQVARGQPPTAAPGTNAVLQRAVDQLGEYFAGRRRQFDLPLAPHGTPFQLEVWAALSTIPFGGRWSYAQLAQALGRATAVRAVGGANARNPLSLVVPCHRVLGASGALTGYAGGTEAKAWLLAHEAALAE